MGHLRNIKLTALYLLPFLLLFALTKNVFAENQININILSQSPRTVFVHLFEWKWTDVADECRNFLGPKGFSAVQVSPPNEHALVENFPWYQRYQPVSYKLQSRSGTREEFIEMINTCKKNGVDIYVDAVINHMAGVVPKGETHYGSAGSLYGHYDYPGSYSSWDFHTCGGRTDNDINDYNNRWEVQNCELVNLADLNTSSEYVQGRISEYLNELVSLGVAGFRIDAAKHISSEDLKGILSRVKGNPYIYQEVIDQGGEPIKAYEYFDNGDVTEFKYSLSIGRIFYDGKLAWLNGSHQFGESWLFMPSDNAIVFIDNHDNQRGHGGGGHVLTHRNPQSYKLANILMLAWPYGYPQIMSSYSFDSGSQGPPSDHQGNTSNIFGSMGMGCLNEPKNSQSNHLNSSGWICEHRWESLTNMVEFRNQTASDFYISNWWSNGNNQIAFSRGNKGFVVINNENQNLETELQTNLSPGLYTNIIDDECGAKTIEVDINSKIKVKVKSFCALAIHVGKKL